MNLWSQNETALVVVLYQGNTQMEKQNYLKKGFFFIEYFHHSSNVVTGYAIIQYLYSQTFNVNSCSTPLNL